MGISVPRSGPAPIYTNFQEEGHLYDKETDEGPIAVALPLSDLTVVNREKIAFALGQTRPVGARSTEEEELYKELQLFSNEDSTFTPERLSPVPSSSDEATEAIMPQEVIGRSREREES